MSERYVGGQDWNRGAAYAKKSARPKEWDEPQDCRQCGKPAEKERWCYATPVCYACLPPPKIRKVDDLSELRRLLEFRCAYCGLPKSDRPPVWCVREHEVFEAALKKRGAKLKATK